MSDIFVSYASEDLERVRPLVNALQDEGWSVWWDRELIAGHSFDEKIEAALDEARCVIVVWSNASIGSRWVRTEANEGLERAILVPVLIDEVRPPLAFRISQAADLIGWPGARGGWDKFIEGITALLGTQPTGPARDDHSIAVLPFANMSSDPEQEFFSDGIAEDILNGLVKIPDLKVIARTSSFQFKGENPDVRDIGTRLGCSHVLEGSVRKAGERVRVTAQLISTTDGAHVWSDQFDRDLNDIFAVQDDVCQAILSALTPRLSHVVLSPATPVPSDAHRHYLQGQYHLLRYNGPAAVEHFKEALTIHPEYADAHVGLARHYNTQAFPAGPKVRVGTRTLGERIRYHAEQALATDPDHAQARAVLATLECYANQTYEKSIRTFHDVAVANPNDEYVLLQYSFAMSMLQDTDAATRITDRMLQVDPANPQSLMFVGFAKLALGDEHGRELMEQAVDLGNRLALPMLVGEALLAGSVDIARDYLDRYQSFPARAEAETHWRLYHGEAVPDEELRTAPIGAPQLVSLARYYDGDLVGAVDTAIEHYRSLVDRGVRWAYITKLGHGAWPQEVMEAAEQDHRYQAIRREMGLDPESITALDVPRLPF